MSDPAPTSAGFSTRAIHVGSEPDPTTGAVSPAIYQTSTFVQDGVGGLRAGYDYSRSGNPTRAALESALAAAEGAAHGYSFGSGLAAETAVLSAALRPGDRMVLPLDVYGGSYRLVSKVLAPWGLEYEAADLTDPAQAEAAITATGADGRPTRLVWVETPTNPLLGIIDIAAVAELAHSVGALLVVDNTFASPYLQQPLALGADVVVHSTTKYIGGHSDVVGGAVLVREDVTVPGFEDVAERVAFYQNSAGGVSGPFDAWLTLRGLKTLAVRMDRHCDNAGTIARWLAGRPEVTRVYYPGLESHPGHDVAARQMRRAGGMVSFQVGSEQKALDLVARTRIITLAESLGGVESLIELPARMTHASVAGSKLEVPADLVRLSVGIEDVDDLLADLDRAL